MKLFFELKSKFLNIKANIDRGMIGKTTVTVKYFLKDMLVKPAA